MRLLGPALDTPGADDRLGLSGEILGQGQPRQPLRLAALGRRVEPEQQRVASGSHHVVEPQADADGLGVIAVMADEQRRGARELVAIRPHVAAAGLR